LRCLRLRSKGRMARRERGELLSARRHALRQSQAGAAAQAAPAAAPFKQEGGAASARQTCRLRDVGQFAATCRLAREYAIRPSSGDGAVTWQNRESRAFRRQRLSRTSVYAASERVNHMRIAFACDAAPASTTRGMFSQEEVSPARRSCVVCEREPRRCC